jgi:transposase-like protein
MAKRSISTEERQRILAEYRNRSEPVSSLCKRPNINQRALYYWLDKDKGKVLGKKSSTVQLLPVLSSEWKRNDRVELILQKGMSLRFSSGASVDYVAAFVKALEQV